MPNIETVGFEIYSPCQIYHDLTSKISTVCKKDMRFKHIGHTKLRSYEPNEVNVSPTSPIMSRLVSDIPLSLLCMYYAFKTIDYVRS